MLQPGQALYDHARDLLAEDRLRRGGKLNPRKVEELFRVQAESPDDRASLAIWSLMVHELWLDQFCSPAGTVAGSVPGVTV
jgi:asparagine synthase (glutamine-hydrolysing)